MRSQPHSWTTLFTKLGMGRKKRNSLPTNGQRRKLCFEQFEDRRMLAAFTVNVAYDTITTDTDNAVITLREAVFRANQTQAHDTILFHPNLTGKTITLGKDAAGADLNLGSEAGELKITEAVTIDAQGKDITIDASGNDNTPGVNDGQGSRVFNLEITALAGETQKVTLDGLTITGGDTAVGMSDPGPGGGIHLKGGGAGNVSFVIRNSKITGNASTGRGEEFLAKTACKHRCLSKILKFQETLPGLAEEVFLLGRTVWKPILSQRRGLLLFLDP